jgi:tetratricopeptide (TPR) repeat protein|tara:strand:- start:64887 stop:67937 length:3051 start_codon:yes stop_codon:yes gene_type:complete
MKMLCTYFLLLLSPVVVQAQEIMTIAATIIDAETKQPVEFVNIGFLEKGIGTVSNANGNFSLSWEPKEIRGADFLQLSSLGYETKQLAIEGLGSLTSYAILIELTPTAYDLETVLLTAEKRSFEKLGSSVYGKDRPAYWYNKEGLGGEIAAKIDIDHPQTLLQDLKFHIRENVSDSLLVRVNIYDYHRGKPGKKVVNRNFFHVIKRKGGEETIPLKEYNIRVDEDVVISLELVEVYGDAIHFEISTSPYKGISFTREVSQDQWREYGSTAVAFHLLSSYPVNPKHMSRSERRRPKKLDIYWDASLPMAKRNISEELKLLGKYFNYLDDVLVRTVIFSKGRWVEAQFDVKNGRSKDLEDYLENTFYNGASDFSEVLQKNPINANAALVFSSGETMFTQLQTALNIPIFCVNSQAEAQHEWLQELSYISGGHYLNLAEMNVNDALEFLQIEKDDTRNYATAGIDKSGYVYGVVHNENGTPLQGALVRIKNTFTEVETGPNGSYAIDAAPGDELSVMAFGMYRKDTTVRALKKLHIPLKTNRELLNEVYLETKTVGEIIGDSVVETPFGKTTKAAVGFSLFQTITSDQITANVSELSQLVNMGRGVEVVPQEIIGTFKYRFRKFKRASFQLETYAAVVIDDIVYDQNQPKVTVPLIDPQQIERITLLNTASSAIRYGSAAAFGAIVIETKNYKKGKELTKNEAKERPSALAVGNEYTETTVALLENAEVPPEYVTALRQATTFEEAKNNYEGLRRKYGDRVPFYLETARYFEKWDTAFAEGVRSNIIALAPTNIRALRALAFEYEVIQNLEDALQLYEHILNVKPTEAQSYLDVARLSAETGAVETSEALYTQLLYNVIPNVDAAELQPQVFSGFKHLIANHKSKINFEELPEQFLKVGYHENIRIVFDWTHSGTDFELQFVNPQNKFFTFSHTAFHNAALLKQEIAQGVSSKEFIIDESIPGRWLINVKHFGTTEIDNPTYLKYTIYRNYGLPSETKEVKVIDLSKYTQKITLDTFML